ncbi:MAG: copper homeostasis protein CutC [Actinomycetota bacterium]
MSLIEIAVQDPAGARIAFDNGAERIELCQALGVGGLTPSIATVDAALEVAGRGDRVAVLVRPRGGGFVYDSEEIALVAADIRAVVGLGAGSVVVGALTADGAIDHEALHRWSEAAGDAGLVFHRAIDTLPDPTSVVDDLIAAGVARVLTSGGAARTIDGTDALAHLAARAAGRLEIVAGGGVRVEDVAPLIRLGVDAVHLSARHTVGEEADSGPGGGRRGHDATDPAVVAAAVNALRHAAPWP